MNKVLETIIFIFTFLAIFLFTWEFVVKKWLKDKANQNLNKIARNNPEIYKNILKVDEKLDIQHLGSKYYLVMNDQKSLITRCDTQEEAERLQNLWRVYTSKMNIDILRSVLEDKHLI